MAGAEEVRRSVRSSRISQHTAASHHSSTSSNSSHKTDRNARISAKDGAPRKLTPSDSLSSEPTDDTVTARVEDGHKMRASRRHVQSVEVEAMLKSKTEAVEDADEDDGTVRCICGLADYPGPPQWTEEDKKQFGDLDFITTEDVTEDLAGFFLSCDACKVWQHGGCVGIKNEDVSPDEYFCEECRKDLHRNFTAADGQKYSLYLPLQPTYSPSTSRAGSFSKDGDLRRRGSSALQHAKRRSTMNSRDAAYDEEEQLRRAIEASRGGNSESIDGGAPSTTKRGKRGRSDSMSADKHESTKRQRTNSRSPSPPQKSPEYESKAESGDDTKGRNTMGSKKIRGAAAKNHNAKEAREEKERQRIEAASKRKGRADRRRVDEDSEPPEESPPILPKAKLISPPPAPHKAEPAPILPPPPPTASEPTPTHAPVAVPLVPTPTHKKGGRPPSSKKGKAGGKNQHSKDSPTSDGNASALKTHGRSLSRDTIKMRDASTTSKDRNGNHPSAETPHSKTGAGRKKLNGNNSSNDDKKSYPKITWTDMNRRVSGMLDYIAKVQVEMADQAAVMGGPVGGTPSSNSSTAEGAGNGVETFMRGLAGVIVPMLQETEKRTGAESADEKSFENMGLTEMMECLTRKLILWQKEFGMV